MNWRIGYYKEKTKNLHAASYAIDQKGNLYLRFICSQKRIYKFDKHLVKIEEIDISPLSDQLIEEIASTTYNRQSMSNRGIFVAFNDYIVLGNLRIFVVNQNGGFLQKFPVNGNDVKGMDKISLAPVYRLDNGKIILHAYTGLGSVLGISKEVQPDYSSTLPIQALYLNHTSIYDDLNDVFGMDVKKPQGFKSIAKKIELCKNSYDSKIFDIFQTSKDTILVRVMFTSRGRSYLPTKDTPYFLYLLNIENGQIVKAFSPKDSSIYDENFYGKVIRLNEEKILFKTHDNIYVLNNNLETIEKISLKDRSFAKLRDFTIIGQHGKTIFFKRSWSKEKELISFDFEDDLVLSLKELIKSYRKIKKVKN